MGVLRLIARIWLVVAQGLGSAARMFGPGARDLEPEHRRDGQGLAALGAAIVLAGATWWSPDATAMRYLSRLVRDGFGTFAGLLPVLLVLAAWRLLRHPERNRDLGRVAIGCAAVVGGLFGIVHIAHGSPSPGKGEHALQSSGGLVGWLISVLPVTLLTAWSVRRLLLLRSASGCSSSPRPRCTGSRNG